MMAIARIVGNGLDLFITALDDGQDHFKPSVWINIVWGMGGNYNSLA